MRKKIIIFLIIIISLFFFWFLWQNISRYQASASQRKLLQAQNQVIEDIINSRREKYTKEPLHDPFGEDKLVQILLIGLDNRIGEQNGHCDAIQLISINSETETIKITAVPRGTYSPLPPGKGVTSTDYYVSNACGSGGLDYGIAQIEKILKIKADYIVVVGFSETLGILRNLKLPTTETLQWLRNRHGYAIGEPQRAHNHSEFIKQMMLRFAPTEQSKVDTILQYIIYKLVKTDLSFAQTQNILEVISGMDIKNHPEKITLSMSSVYSVQDIPYDPEKIDESLEQTLGQIKDRLNKNDYSGITQEMAQANLLDIFEENKNNPEFISWAYENNLWLQIEDTEKRLTIQYDLLVKYLPLLPNKEDRESEIVFYIVSMQNINELTWEEKGRELLKQEMD